MGETLKLVPVALAMALQGLTLTLSQSAMATPLAVNWAYEVNIEKGAPTPDLASKAIAAAGMLFESVTVAHGSDAGTIDFKGFELRSNIKGTNLLSMLDSNLNMIRVSNGQFVKGVASTQRYSDKRGSNPELLFAADTKQKKYVFTNGSQPARSEPMKSPVVDIAMLPYAFIGRPVPKTVSSIAFTDGKSIFSTNLTQRPEKFELAGEFIAAVHLSGAASGGTLDLWVREADGYPLQMRVGFDAQNGAVLDQKVEAVPAALFVLDNQPQPVKASAKSRPPPR